MSVEVEAATSGLSRGLVHELLTAAWVEPAVRTFGEPNAGASRAPATARLGIRGFGASVRVNDRTGLGLVNQVRALLPAALIDRPDGRFQRELFASTRVDGRISLWGQFGAFSVADPGSAIRMLLGMVDFTIATETTEALFVHAGVVGWRGRAVLVPGRSGTGKSSLVAALVRHGADYYSDEFAPLDAGGRVHPYARVPSLGETPPQNGDMPPLPVGAILCTAFTPGASWQPKVVRGARGLLPILDNTLVCRDRPRSALAAAKSIASATTLAGVRPDADEVAPEMLARIDQIFARDARREQP